MSKRNTHMHILSHTHTHTHTHKHTHIHTHTTPHHATYREKDVIRKG